MRINADLTRRVVVDTGTVDWIPSPAEGVERRMLEREGDEVARATSLVRYSPGSWFPRHVHRGGEEILVLEGVLTDEHGDYPAGTYLRNPPGSAHEPSSREGCLLLVKLLQMHPGEQERHVVDTRAGEWRQARPDGPERMELFRDEAQGETVALVRFPPRARVEGDLHVGGEEVYVLAGLLEDEHGRYPAGTWLRQPHGSRHSPFSGEGCTLFVKRGHLPR
jgi:anti-sigma factor ChrR (cupin superfamily)